MAGVFLVEGFSLLLKPFRPEPTLLLLGSHISVGANLIIAPMLGVVLMVYGVGILMMKRYALPLAYLCAVFAVLNFAGWEIASPPRSQFQAAARAVYIALILGASVFAAVALTIRRTQLG